MATEIEQNIAVAQAFARRGPDGQAQIGPTKFDLRGIRFVTDNEGNDSTEVDDTEGSETEEVEETEEETEEVEEDAFTEERTKLTGTISKLRDEGKTKNKTIRDLKAQLAAANKPVDESEIDAAKREAAAEERTKSDARILRSEIRAAAASKFADPKDALAFLDLSEFEVDENGDVDSDAIEDALTDLLEKKPHLAAAPQKRFQGGGHQGAKAPAKPSQLTAEQYNAMSREEKRKARNEGRVNKILGAN